MSALPDFTSESSTALPLVEQGTPTTESPLIRRGWHCRHEPFADYLQWCYNTNINMLPLDLKHKFEDAIAATREHELAIATLVVNDRIPETTFVTRGYRRALQALKCRLKDQVVDGVALDTMFNLKVAREISRRIEVARNLGLCPQEDVSHRQSEHMS